MHKRITCREIRVIISVYLVAILYENFILTILIDSVRKNHFPLGRLFALDRSVPEILIATVCLIGQFMMMNNENLEHLEFI